MFPSLTNQKLHYFIFCYVTYDCQKIDIMKVAPYVP